MNYKNNNSKWRTYKGILSNEEKVRESGKSIEEKMHMLPWHWRTGFHCQERLGVSNLSGLGQPSPE